jgi:Mrp family chromosome partitioning ATPase
MGVVTRRWRIIALFTILGVLAAGLFLHRENKAYISHAQVLVTAPSADPFSATKTPTTTSVIMPTEEKLATSASVADAVAAKLDNGKTGQQLLTHLTVTIPATTQILDFAYSANSAVVAQHGAQAFADTYLSNRKDNNQRIITATTKRIRAEIATVAKQKDALEKKINPNDPSQNQVLDGQIQGLATQINQYDGQLAALSTVDPSAAYINQKATLPTTRTGTAARTLGAAGLVAGLVIGLIAAFIADGLDDHLRGPADLYAAVGVPVLARIPLLRHLPWRRLDLSAEGTSHPKIAEAYRHLASRLLVLGVGGSVRSILVASPAESDGRSSVSANLAAVYVDLGYRVWLVSADLAPPQVHTLMAPTGPSNLISVLPITARESAASTALEQYADADLEGQGHLTLMSGSGQRQTAGRLLHPLHLGRQIVHNQQHVDITIIDAPPMLDFADAIPLIPVVDAVVVVADAGTTKRSELHELVELLENSKAHIIGGVLNRDGSRVVSRRARRARRRMEHLLHPGSTKSSDSRPAASASAGTAERSASSGRRTSPPEQPTAPEPDFAGSAASTGKPQSHAHRRLLGWPRSEETVTRD